MFVVFSVATILEPVVLIFPPELVLDAVSGAKVPSLRYTEVAALVFPIISGIIVVVGILRFRSSHLRAYRCSSAPPLTSVFPTQAIAFYRNQFVAVFGPAINILMLLGIQYLINQENGVYPMEPKEG